MTGTIEKKIQNYIQRKYIKGLVEGYDLKKTMRTNVLIKSYFIEKMSHLAYDDNVKQRKFFFSFRTKYIDTFKKHKQLVNSSIYQFSNSKISKKFKNQYTQKEWIEINGDTLLKFLALENKMNGRKIDFDAIGDCIEIIHCIKPNSNQLIGY